MFRSAEDGAYLVALAEGVLTITLNRPENGNAMNSGIIPGIAQLFEEANDHAEVRCILVRAEGKTFSAGADMAIFRQTLEQDVATRQAEFRRRLSNLRRLVESVSAYEGPVVVAMRGAAVGVGLAYPLAADVVIGDPTALFAFAHQTMGLPPDGGVSSLLPQIVGPRTARRLVMTAARVEAQEALRLGLLDRVVPAEELEAAAAKQAARFARAPRRALRLAKRLMKQGLERPFKDQVDAELEGVVECVGDPDFEEGVRAFLEKRSPRFPSAG
jgi:2-(1,2-epoxy-1,2-dihydrophenyl)acetyl-CoA isomerase